MEIMISLLLAIIVAELYAWLPRISQALVKWAVLQIPCPDRPRYQEEWQSHLNDSPNTIACAITALCLCITSRRIKATLTNARYEHTQKSICALLQRLQEGISEVNRLRRIMSKERNSPQLKPVIDLIASEPELSVSDSLQIIVNRLGRAAAIAYDKECRFREAQFDAAELRLTLACRFIECALHKYAQLESHELSLLVNDEIIPERVANDIQKAVDLYQGKPSDDPVLLGHEAKILTAASEAKHSKSEVVALGLEFKSHLRAPHERRK